MKDIVKALNEYIEYKRTLNNLNNIKGHLVFKSFIDVNEKYPVLKNYTYELYFVSDKSYRVITCSNNYRFIKGQTDENSIIKSMNNQFIRLIFHFIDVKKDLFDKIIDGTYNTNL